MGFTVNCYGIVVLLGKEYLKSHICQLMRNKHDKVFQKLDGRLSQLCRQFKQLRKENLN